MGEAQEQPLIDGITAAVLGVRDFEPSLGFYCGHLGWEIADKGILPAETAQALWGPSLGEVEVMALCAAGADTGRIHLVRVPDPGSPAERPHNLDEGLIGIDMYAKDIAAAHDSLSTSGIEWLGGPATYDVPLGNQTVQVTQGACPAPEGVMLVFVQPAAARETAAWRVDPQRAFTELTSVVCHVPDPDAEIALWGPDGLGMSIWYDLTFSAPGFDAVADLPAGTRMRLAFLAGARTARIEVTSAEGPHREDRRLAQRPGHSLGHSGWSVRTRDLETALTRAERAGARRGGDAVFTSDPLHGRARAASITSPSGIAVDLWQPVE